MKLTNSEKRFVSRAVKELDVPKEDALFAVAGHRAIRDRNWDYTWQDDWDPETGDKMNLVLLVDEHGAELARGWEYTFSDIGIWWEAGSTAYYEDLRLRELDAGEMLSENPGQTRKLKNKLLR